jgi:hypothetical protein
VQLTTWLLHTSGQWLCGTASLPAAWRGPRGFGSAVTYARRYCLAAMLGLCVEEDDEPAPAGELPPAHTAGRRRRELVGSELARGEEYAGVGMNSRTARAAPGKQPGSTGGHGGRDDMSPE